MVIAEDPNLIRKTKFLEDHADDARRLDDGMPVFSHVEFSICGLCNRFCAFCPRADPEVYDNKNEFMSLELYTKVMHDLAAINYVGSMSYSGFSEPILHKGIVEMTRITKQIVPGCRLRMNTNGDKLTPKMLTDLHAAGMDDLLISLYDGPEQAEVFNQMAADAGVPDDWVMLRARYFSEAENFGLRLSNRAGTVTKLEHLGIKKLTEPLNRPCYYPMYLVMVDHTGQVVICSHDWGMNLIVGDLNTQSIVDIWRGPRMSQARERLMRADRHFSPCDVCDVRGTIQGDHHMKVWSEYLDGGD